jgi:hypothetical protein
MIPRKMPRQWIGIVLALPLAGYAQKAAGTADRALGIPQVLWRAPHPMSVEDWTCGPSGCNQAPKPPFQFVKEDLSGSNLKVSVRDANGREWDVKFGGEAIPEVFAPRYLNALGYRGETTYFVRSGKIEGVHGLRRAHYVVHKDGTFRNGRFERRNQPDFEFLKDQTWAWDNNPFKGSHELGGLKVVMMLLSNWDAKDGRDGPESNNAVFRATGANGPELDFVVFDWGASLGQWGGKNRRDKSDCSGYWVDTPHFVERTGQNGLQWGYSGKRGEDIKRGVSIDDIRWLTPYLSTITKEQLQAGLKASGATDRQATCWASAIDNRTRQLEAVAK